MVNSTWISYLIRNGEYKEGDVIKLKLEQKISRKDSTDIGIFSTLQGDSISINLPKWDKWLIQGNWYDTKIIVNHHNGREYVNGQYTEISDPHIDEEQACLTELFDEVERMEDVSEQSSPDWDTCNTWICKEIEATREKLRILERTYEMINDWRKDRR